MTDRWLSLLLTQAWQLTLVILVVALLSRRLANKRPHLAVALWLVVLAKAITPPVWSSPLGVFSWSIPTSTPALMEVEPARSTSPPVTASAPLPSPEPWPAPSTELISLPNEPVEATAIVATAPPSEVSLLDVDHGPTVPRHWSWTGIALSLWLAGAGLTLLILCSRLAILWRRLSRAGAAADDALAAQIDALRKRLKLRRRIRVWVTPTDHGPAVLGLFRPWLLLPKTLVDRVAPDDLEPLLAHELLHIRRGDLWIGWWQAVVQAAWWLHPLVWWSNRVLTRQLERCCDEEVLAELGCEPARYARGLLKALELKHRLQPVPAAPGVRPVDLTAERMERIMRTGQGSRRRTPWWCWGVLGVGLLVTLPGAGLQLGAEEPAKVLSGVGVNSDAGVTGTVVLGEAASQPRNPGTLPTVEEILRIHRENRAKLNPLHLRVTVTHEKTKAAQQQAKAEVTRLTEVLKRLGDDDVEAETADGQKVIIAAAEFKAELRRELKFEEFAASAPPHVEFLELFRDGEKCQTRTPPSGGDESQKWVFPDEPLTAETLLTTYRKMRIYSRSPQLTPPARIWQGWHNDSRPPIVQLSTKSVAASQILSLPPYTDWIESTVDRRHPVDLALSQPASRWRVTGQAIIDGRTLTIVEIVAPAGWSSTVRGKDGKMVEADMAEFCRCWLDLARGAVPVRIESLTSAEWSSFESVDRWGADKVVSAIEIRKLENGAFYPTVTVREVLKRDPDSPEITNELWEKINAGQHKLVTVPFERMTWVCSTAETAFPHDDKFFVLNVPETTEYFDLDSGTTVGTPPHASPLKPGRPAPELSVARWVGGTRHSLQDLRGRVVVLNFGGLTSKATDGTREALKRLQARYRTQPVTFLSVQPADKSPDSVAVRLQEQAIFHDWTIPTAIDAGTMRQNSQTYRTYGIESSDGNVVIDPTGRVVFHSDAVFAEVNEEIASNFVEDELVEKKAEQAFEAIMKPIFAAIGEPWPPREDLTPEQNTALSLRIQEYMLSRAIDEALKKVISRGRAEPQQPPADANRGAAPVPERNAPLDQRVTMTIKDRPLDELLAELARQHEFSFVIDQVGLEEEGVRKSVPVSGEFRDVALRNMLKLLVEQTQNLVLQERDGVLLITSRGRAEPLEVRTYAVADFLVPLPGTELSSNESSEPRKDLTTPMQRAKALIGLIHSTVQPDSWVEAGGKGQIQSYEATLSLVIRQTPSVHEQIAELFDQLRRRHVAQVSLQLVERVITAEDWKAFNPNGNRQPIVWDVSGLPAANSPKVTFFNGQRASLPSELVKHRKDRAILLNFDVIPVIAEDQKSVTLTLLPTTHLSRFVPRSINVPDGKTALIDISDTLPASDPALQNGGHVVLEITPRVILPEEPGTQKK